MSPPGRREKSLNYPGSGSEERLPVAVREPRSHLRATLEHEAAAGPWAPLGWGRGDEFALAGNGTGVSSSSFPAFFVPHPLTHLLTQHLLACQE